MSLEGGGEPAGPDETAEALLDLAFFAMRVVGRYGRDFELINDPDVRELLRQSDRVWRAFGPVAQGEILAGRRPW